MSTYSKIEEMSIFAVRVPVIKPTAEEMRDPAMPPQHRSYFSMLCHPAMAVAEHRANVLAAAHAAVYKSPLTSMPADLLEMAKSLDVLVVGNCNACAAALRKMNRTIRKWAAVHGHTKTWHTAGSLSGKSGLAPCDELDFEELIESISFPTHHVPQESFETVLGDL